MSPDDLITTREAMDVLGYADPSSITRAVAERKLTPARKLPGRTGAYLFDRAEVQRLLDERAGAAS